MTPTATPAEWRDCQSANSAQAGTGCFPTRQAAMVARLTGALSIRAGSMTAANWSDTPSWANPALNDREGAAAEVDDRFTVRVAINTCYHAFTQSVVLGASTLCKSSGRIHRPIYS